MFWLQPFCKFDELGQPKGLLRSAWWLVSISEVVRWPSNAGVIRISWMRRWVDGLDPVDSSSGVLLEEGDLFSLET